MASNDFASVSSVLAEDFILEWPQSKERIRGSKNFAQMNSEYPAHGPWQFRIVRVIANDSEGVSEVEVTDGIQHGRAISFFTIAGSKITKIVEFWPDPYPPSVRRAHLVELMA